MSAPTNDKLYFANKLNKGETTYGTFMTFSSGWTARVIASVGWDWVLVDCEHGNIGDSDMHDSVTAVVAAGSSPVVRIRNADIGLIKRALDTGAHGLMVPMVNTAEEARDIVKWSKFPPQGVRGQGSPFAAWTHGLTIPGYVQSANDSVIVMPQIETAEAVANADAILAVDGVDAVFIGPSDLALGVLGYAPPKWNEPEFIKLIDSVVASCKKANKPCGILAPDGETAKWIREKWDIKIMGVGNDFKAITGFMSKQLKDAKSTQ